MYIDAHGMCISHAVNVKNIQAARVAHGAENPSVSHMYLAVGSPAPFQGSDDRFVLDGWLHMNWVECADRMH